LEFYKFIEFVVFVELIELIELIEFVELIELIPGSRLTAHGLKYKYYFTLCAMPFALCSCSINPQSAIPIPQSIHSHFRIHISLTSAL